MFYQVSPRSLGKAVQKKKLYVERYVLVSCWFQWRNLQEIFLECRAKKTVENDHYLLFGIQMSGNLKYKHILSLGIQLSTQKGQWRALWPQWICLKAEGHFFYLIQISRKLICFCILRFSSKKKIHWTLQNIQEP